MKIFITGSTGFIGKNLVKYLLKNNHSVTCLVRNTNHDDIFKQCRLVQGDILSPETYGAELRKCAVVFHLAGLLGHNSKKDVLRVNVDGTKALLGMCTKQRFIYCSSAGIYGSIVKGTLSSVPKPINNYEKSKFFAEEAVKKYRNHVIIRPEFVYGPYDKHVLQLFKTVKRGRFCLIDKGRSLLHPTYVDDVVRCMIKVIRTKKRELLVVGPEAVTVYEFVSLIANHLGVKRPWLNIPRSIAWFYSRYPAKIISAIGIDPVLTYDRYRFFTESRSFVCDKTIMDQYTALNEGIKRTISWYKEEGWL
jgi:nucleoside-diphosphate-sugar epimerase